MKKSPRIALVLTLCLLLSACAPAAPKGPAMNRYEASFLELFDTVTTVVGFAPTQEAFLETVEDMKAELTIYHRLYDIYNDYDGVNNIKTINDNAGVAPVKVDSRILDLLEFSEALYEASQGTVNIAMGSVLRLWHEAREAGIHDPQNAALPGEDTLMEAKNHISFNTVVIDREASTVFLTDPRQKLDVGAVAKGYALEQVCKAITEPMIVSLGGNVRVTGPKPDGTPWVVGVQDPDGGESYLHTLYAEFGSVVTSGDYQRYYTVDGVRYHHIIDSKTCYPADRYRAVTILCPDSGTADGLATALFNMTQEEGQALLEAYGAEAMWVLPDGTFLYTPGFQEAIRT